MRKSETNNKVPVERLRTFLEIEDDEVAQMSLEEMHEELRLLGMNPSEFSASLRTHVCAVLSDSEFVNTSISKGDDDKSHNTDRHGNRLEREKTVYAVDVIQIVDAYPRYHDVRTEIMKVNAADEAHSLSLLIESLGRKSSKVAIVSHNDNERAIAYKRAGYEVYPMSGDRSVELRSFILQMVARVRQEQPKHMVLVSDDPEFVQLCDATASLTYLSVWADSTSVPPELTAPQYGWRPLEELLPNLKIPRIDVRIDLENIFIGLLKRGWQPNMRELIASIHKAMEDLGKIVAVTGYADFDELNRHHGAQNTNWQREFILAGGETRYVINQHGKKTADMKIADDLRTLVELTSEVGATIDIIGLATMDRDFRHIVNTARFRGKKVVLMGVAGELSRELESAASEVRYLDNYLKLSESTLALAEPSQRQKGLLMTEGATESHVARVMSRPLSIFLCHSAEDKPKVRELYNRLRASGMEPWLDEENLSPGQTWAQEILKAVRASDIVIVCLSKESINKYGYIQKEINFALDVAYEQPEDSIFIIPARLESCEVPRQLGQWHWVNLFEERGYEQLLNTCIKLNTVLRKLGLSNR